MFLPDPVSLLRAAITDCCQAVVYRSHEYSIPHKLFALQAFQQLLEESPRELSNYLLCRSYKGGFQHRAFQHYLHLLENSLPLYVRKKRQLIQIDSLLHPQLSLFDGISEFEAMVDEQQRIKNGTREFYVGNRKAYHTKPYFLGKLLAISDDQNRSLLPYVSHYSFHYIQLRDIASGTPVRISHLRMVPHYQAGGMVFINRARQQIIQRAKEMDQNASI